jgi:hypothetical protein
MGAFATEVEDRRALQPADPWPPSERTVAKRDARVSKSMKSFEFFDKTYFTPEMYSGGYAAPCRMHKDIVTFTGTPGVHVVLGPRDHGKTVTAKKAAVWRIVTGQIHVGGTISHTLPTSQNILADIAGLIRENPRITSDFGVEFTQDNAEQFALRTNVAKHTTFFAAFSEGKSVRGYARAFARPQLLVGDDIETRTSPLGEEHAKSRIKYASEAYRSLTKDGTMLWLGNNFDERCATNMLKIESERAILPEGWHVHVYRAWSGTRPLWRERFPATSETEMRSMLRSTSESDYQGNDQQNPVPDQGDVFPRDFYQEWATIPADAKGVLITDPNLSLKEKGDTTAILLLLYSPSVDAYYVARVRCKSYRTPDDLLDDTLGMRDARNTIALYWDGNVSQEAHWTNHVRSWCQKRGQAFPRIIYHRYHVDVLTKNAQLVYGQKKLFFPPGMEKGFGEHGAEAAIALRQFYAFSGKKKNRKDDFPDVLICGIEALNEIGFARPRPTSKNGDTRGRFWTTSITDEVEF